MRLTQKALMARGLDSETALDLARKGWTLSKIKQTNVDDLANAGFSVEFIKNLSKEGRPPIPDQVLMKVLFDNRFQCCVCRNPNRPIIIHHIDEWAKSHSHAIENLAVLCLEHHDAAHSKKILSQNLDRKTLLALKKSWEEQVKVSDARAILDAMKLEYSTWNYINELRVFEISNELGLTPVQSKWGLNAVAKGVAGINGLPTPILNDDGMFWMYEGAYGIDRYFYTSYALNEVIQHLEVVNISDYLEKGLLTYALAPGDFIFVQGSHVFSPLGQKRSGKGRGQICQGTRRANGVEVTFVFDRWEATSSSAKSCWLVGTRDQGSLVQVKDVSRSEGNLIVRGTVLGISSNFGKLKKREYAQRWLSWRPKVSGTVKTKVWSMGA
jgi:hypothetical protein